MGVESAKQDIKGSYGEGFVIMGTDRIEVSPDDKKVTAYTNDGVETKPASGTAITRDGAISEGAVPLSRDGGISISADFNTVVLNGATIERAPDGHLVISAPGTVITKPGPANESAAKGKTAPEIGDEVADGTIYAGISPDTHKPMYARPNDESGTYSFNEAAKHAKNIDDGFHVPTKNELNVLYENRNKGKLKGTFNETGSAPAGWYWSSTPDHSYLAWAQRFSDGNQYDGAHKYVGSSLRLVR
jgi:hypothetical protein